MIRTLATRRTTFSICGCAILGVLMMVIGGCAKSAASGWAQTSPLISPISPTTETVSLGARGG